MDKYEYKVRAEEIKTLITQKKYTEAVKIADSVDWTRVRSVLMLCTVSDLYKINRRLAESRDILLMAYERNPNGRTIVYSLCELSIKLGEVVQAVEYYKEYVQLAPRDTGRFILQYKLYEAQEVSLEERIAVLEEFKKRDYREKWAYELAYLYHRVGLATRCVEECDDLILWFGEGKYVMKAMELKMLHEPLNQMQQKKYRIMKGEVSSSCKATEEDIYYPEEEDSGEVMESAEPEMDIQVKPMKMGQYDTINLQKELAENMKEFLLQEQEPEQERHSTALEEVRYVENLPREYEPEETGSMTQEIVATLLENTGEMKQITPRYEEEDYPEDDSQYDGYERDEEDYDTDDEYGDAYEQETLFAEEEAPEPEDTWEEELTDADVQELPDVEEEEPQAEEIFFEDHTEEIPAVLQEELNPQIARMLSQEYDGQISLVVPEAEKLEKQITGQMSIEDILTEWERMKKANEEKRAEDVRKRVLEQTGAMFSEFDASTRNGILEQLEEAARRQSERDGDEEEPEEDPEDLNGEETGAETEDCGESQPEEDFEEPVEEEFAEEPEDILEEEDEAEADSEDSEEEGTLQEEADLTEDGTELGEEEGSGEEENGEEPKEPAAGETREEPENSGGKAEKAVAAAEKVSENSPGTGRSMTREEEEAFESYIQTKQEKEQIIQAIDSMSLAPCTGNVIITGDAGADKVELAKELMKAVQQSDSNFSGKVAKITGRALNNKEIAPTLKKISNGALIIEKAGELKPETLKTLNKILEKDNGGIIILMEDTAKAMDHMLESCPAIRANFNARIDIEALNNDALVAAGIKYANEMEYALDELSRLALYTRVADMQTSEHAVTVTEVKQIIDEAIESANRKNIGHFRDLLLAKRYDEEDMIILREKDFISY